MDMAATFLAATTDRFFMFHTTNRGAHLQFVGGTEVPFAQDLIDRAAFNDLVSYGLLRVIYRGRHNTNYELSGDSIRFHSFLRKLRGTPIDDVEQSSRPLLESAAFARRFPTVTRHLDRARELLWSEHATSEQVASEIGHQLRSALIEITAAATGETTKVEQVKPSLQRWVAGQRPSRESRAIASLVQLAIDVQDLNQRATHIRDEQAKGEAPIGHEELRRAVLLTTLCCAELARLAPSTD